LPVELSSPHKTITTTAPSKYMIYAYPSYDSTCIGQNRWSLLNSGHDQEEILQKAENMYQTQQYQKIEVQKKTFNNKKGKYVISTHRIFTEKSKNNYLMLATIFLLAFASVGLFYLKHS